jgi:predicted nucleotidyltransferase
MPIDIDRFEGGDIHTPTTSEQILRFLIASDNQAYTRQEIADAIDVNPETVGTNLTRLKDHELVRHREPYWALTDDHDRAVETLRTRYDTETTSVSQSITETTRPHYEAATTFAERVRDRLGDSIDALYLFGSVAHRTATADSDVDIFAVIADDVDYTTVDDQLLEIAYDVQLEYGVRVEVHSLRANEFDARKESGDPFIHTVVEEGVVSV